MKIQLETDNTANTFDNSNLNSNPETKGSDEVKKMLRSGVKAAQAGDRAEARNFLLNVTEADPENEDAWLWLASISEYPEELLIFLNNVLKINPENEKALEWAKATRALLSKTFVERGIKASEDEQKEFAKQCFLQAIVHDDQNELAWLWLASISDVAEEKRSYLQKVLRINPENETALVSLQKSKTKLAKSLLDKANDAAAEGNVESALESLKQSLKQSPDLEEAWILKSHLTTSLSEKLACFEKVLELNPENPIAQAGVASLKSIVGRSAPESVDEKVSEPETTPQVEEEPEAEKAEVANPSEETEPEVESKTADSYLDESGDLLELKPEEPKMPEVDEVETVDEPEVEKVDDVQTESESVESLSPEEESKEFAVHKEEATESPEEEANEETTVSFEEVIAQQETVSFEYSDLKLPGQDEIDETPETEVEETHFEEPSEDNDQPVEMEMKVETETSESDEEEEIPVPPMPQFQDKTESPEFEELQKTFGEDTGALTNLPEKEVEVVKSFANESPVEKSETVAEALPEPVSVKESPKAEKDEATDTAEEDFSECPFCESVNKKEEFVCQSCHAMLTLSDVEMLLAHRGSDQKVLTQAVLKMEAEKGSRQLTVEELTNWGIAEINLRNYRKGFELLQEATRIKPGNVLLNSQVNSLAIRISEIEQQASINDNQPKNKTILVVDDSATVRKLITSKLEKCGHEVICAVDGKDALEKINEVIPDLILLDITMPRMDGYQVCKLIRSNDVTKEVPVVMISGKDGFFDKVRGRMAGTTGYITKPFGPETLMKTVDAYLD